MRYGSTEKKSPIALEQATDTLESVTDTEISLPTNDAGGKALKSLQDEYDETGFSTIDSFIRGKIGMVV
jgi:hypothetical protein